MLFRIFIPYFIYIIFLIFNIIVVLCSCYILIVHMFATFMYIGYIYLSSDNLYCFVQNCVFQISVEGFVQLRNISLSYTYIVIVKHGCLCKILWVFFSDGWGGGALRGGLVRRVIQCRTTTADSMNKSECEIKM